MNNAYKFNCQTCGAEVFCDDPRLVVLSCTPNYTAFTRKGQDTKVVGHTHGLGEPLHVEL